MGVHPEASKSPVNVPKSSSTCSRGIFCNIKVRSGAPAAMREEEAGPESSPGASCW